MMLCNRSKLYVTYRGEDREQRSDPDNSWEASKCTNAEFTQAVGVELCGEVLMPGKKNGLLTLGPAYARVYLNKRDTFTGVHFEASYQNNKVGILICR